MKSKVFVFLLLASSLAFGTTYIFDPAGNDANDCLTTGTACKTPQHATAIAIPGDVVQFRSGLYTFPTTGFHNRVPWTFTAANSGTSGSHISYTNYAGDTPIFTGSFAATTLNGLFTDGGAICGTGCEAWYTDLDADVTHTPHYVLFDALFYGTPLSRRPRAQIKRQNGNNQSDDPQMCVKPANNGTNGCSGAAQCANVACGCDPLGVNGFGCGVTSTVFCPDTNGGGETYFCHNKTVLKHADDMLSTWTGAKIGDVELDVFEIWTMSRLRLKNLAIESGRTVAYTLGPSAGSDDSSGFIPGKNYLIKGPCELAKAGDWCLDRDTNDDGIVDNTWRLWIFAAAGEVPNTDQITIPQMDGSAPQLLIANGLQYVDFSGLTFEQDNAVLGQYGLPGRQGQPFTPAAVEFTDSKFITWDSNQIYHTQGWAFSFVGDSGGDGIDASDEEFTHLTTANSWVTGTATKIQNSTFWDTGAGGVRLGKIACPSAGSNLGGGCTNDTNTNIPRYLIFRNNAVNSTGRSDYSGEATSIYLGGAHHTLIKHNDVLGNYCGGVNFGHGLNRGQMGGNTAFFMHHNELSWNLIQGEGTAGNFNAVCNDFGGIYSADNLSDQCPMLTGDPGLVRANHCNWIENNTVKDIAANWNDLAHNGAWGIYLDQGASYNWIYQNLITRIAWGCLKNPTPSHGGGNPNAEWLDQWNTWLNNIAGPCGPTQYGTRGHLFQRAGDNPGSFRARSNIFYYNSGTGMKFQKQPGHWGCFDYVPAPHQPIDPVDCRTQWIFEFNLRWDVGLQPLDSVTCTLSNCAAFTHYAGMPWNGEDAGSISRDPGFVDPRYPTDKFSPTADLSSIDFHIWPFSTAGRTSAVLNSSSTPNTWPVLNINSATDYLPTISPTGFTVYGGSKDPGNFVIGGTNPAPPPPPPTPTAGNDRYCLAGDIPNFGAQSDGPGAGPSGLPIGGATPALLPVACFFTDPSIMISGGVTQNVSSGSVADFITKYTNAACGDIVQLPVAAYVALSSGGIVLPTKACDATHWLTVRTADYASLPAYGTRLTPCMAGVASLPGRPEYNCPTPVNHMAKIQSGAFAGGGTVALSIGAGTKYVRFLGLEFTRSTGNGLQSALIKFAGGGNSHIVFDHVWMHGVEAKGTTLDELTRSFIGARNDYISVHDSTFTDFWCRQGGTSCDSQSFLFGVCSATPPADCSGDTDHAIKIVNNFLEGAGENIMSGGGSANVIPSDFEIRLNHLFKPMTQNPLDGAFNGGFTNVIGSSVCATGVQCTVVKNLLEFKSANRVLIEANILENSWAGSGQLGQGLTLGPRTQAGACPICAVTNVVYRYDRQRTTGTAWELFYAPVSGSWAAAGYGWSLHDNINENLFYPTCNACALTQGTEGPEQQPGVPTATQVLHDLNVNKNDFIFANPALGQHNYFMGISGALISSGLNIYNITHTNNVIARGKLGGTLNVVGGGDPANCAFGMSDGAQMINACWNPMVWGGNTIVANKTTVWPTGIVPDCLKDASNNDLTFSGIFKYYSTGLDDDYHILVSSNCHNTATDGGDPGPNIDLLNLNLVGVSGYSTNSTSAAKNTSSGCQGAGDPHAGCTGAFTALTDPNVGAQTVQVTRAPDKTLSPLSVHDLMYTGWTGRFVADYQPWFGCGSHINVGYNENTPATVAYQIQKMIAQGYDSISIDYYGTHASQSCLKVTVDAIAAYLLANAPRARSGKKFTLILMLDKGALQPYCPTGATDQTTCLITNMNLQLDTINSSYATKPYYEIDAAGHALVQTFIDEAAWSGSNWVTILAAVSAHVKAYTVPFDLLKWGVNFSEAGYDGVYAWPKPPNWSAGNQICWDDQQGGSLSQCADDGVGIGSSYLDGFYTDAKAHPTKIAMGLFFRGFDDNNAPWGLNRVIAQQCGQVLINSIAKVASNGYGTGLQIPYMHVATYNDHEEGTGIENGTDNCYTVAGIAGAPSAHNLTRTLTPTDATYSTLSTIAYWRVLYDAGGGTLKEAVTHIPASTAAVDLTNLVPVGTFNVYIEMVGKPGIRNKLSAAVSFTN